MNKWRFFYLILSIGWGGMFVYFMTLPFIMVNLLGDIVSLTAFSIVRWISIDNKYWSTQANRSAYRDTGESGDTYNVEYDSDSHNYYAETLAERRT